MSLENIAGNLREAYAQIEPGTMQHADQITTERRTDESLRNLRFHTADGPIYFTGKDREMNADGTPQLALTREPQNLVLRHIDAAFKQLTTDGNYRPDRKEAQAAINSEDTLVVDLGKLHLKGDDAEWRYLEIGTSPNQYDRLNSEERKLAERYFGADFGQSMKLFKDSGIKTTRVYVLNPEYVSTEASKNPVSRASWLNIFNDDSFAYADIRDVNYDGGRVRGVLLVVEKKVQGKVGKPQIKVPSLDDILAVSKPFVLENAQKQYEAAMRQLFNQ